MSWTDSGARTGPHEIGLIAKIAASNDDDAARRLYRKYRMELFRFGFHVLNDQGLAEEMVQETFIKFCQQAGSYDATRGPVRALAVHDGPLGRLSTSPGAPHPGRCCLLRTSSCHPNMTPSMKRSRSSRVDQALDKLPSIYADVMRLVRDGFTQSEIAERLGIPVGTVKSRMAKAADTLRAELASLRGGDDAF